MKQQTKAPTQKAGANLDRQPQRSTRQRFVSLQHKAAVMYAMWGIPVGTLDGKAPTMRGGANAFTTNIELVNAWFSRWPHANVGARPPKGVVVLDVDPKNNGHETWENLVSPHQYSDLEHTLVTRTGSGGWHAWYLLPFDRATRGTIGHGIDVMTGGNRETKTGARQLVMPPSIHPTTGQQYHILNWVWPPQPLPKFFWKHVYTPLSQPRTYSPARRVLKAGGGAGLVRAVAEAADGARNSTLYWAVMRMVEDQLPDLESDLLEAATSAGLSEVEAQNTIASALQRGQREYGLGAA